MPADAPASTANPRPGRRSAEAVVTKTVSRRRTLLAGSAGVAAVLVGCGGTGGKSKQAVSASPGKPVLGGQFKFVSKTPPYTLDPSSEAAVHLNNGYILFAEIPAVAFLHQELRRSDDGAL